MTKSLADLNPKIKPKMLVTDLDDTLMIHGVIPPSSIAIIDIIMASTDAEIVIASARPYHNLKRTIENSPLNQYFHQRIHLGGFNGNHATYKNKVIRDNALPQAVIERAHTQFPDNEKAYFTIDQIMSPEPGSAWMRWYAHNIHEPIQQTQHLTQDIYMLEIKVPPQTASNETACAVHTFTPPFANPPETAQWAQYTGKGGKLAMAEAYARATGIPLSLFLCIGDGPNDDDMLLHPDTIGIAMGNSKLDADNIYKTKTAREDGFAHAMERAFR